MKKIILPPPLLLIINYVADIGAAYGTAKSGVGISSMGVMNPQLVMRNIIPVVMAGVLGIYGLIVAVIIQGSSEYLYFKIYFDTVSYYSCFPSHIFDLTHLVCTALDIRHLTAVLTPDATGATKYSSFTGYAHLSAGLCCGLRYVLYKE